MKGLKWLLLIAALVSILILSSCGSITGIKPSLAHNIVEVTANNVDSKLTNLASWCYTEQILMLWYDYDAQSTVFSERIDYFQPLAADKNVYLNNEFVGNYDLTNLDQTINASKTTFSGTLIMYLRMNSSLTWDLYIGEDRQTKAITNYVLVEFQEIDTTNHVYQVTKAQVRGEWDKLDVPKNMSSITNKGFAFFKIQDDKVVDARVIYP